MINRVPKELSLQYDKNKFTCELSKQFINENLGGAKKCGVTRFMQKNFRYGSDYVIVGKYAYREHTYMLTKETADLLCSSYDIRHRYVRKVKDLRIKNVVMSLENSTIGFICAALKPLFPAMVREYKVEKYRVDLYMPEINLCVECDECGHQEYNAAQETERQTVIEKKLACRFLRFNPNAIDFDMSDVIADILKAYKPGDSTGVEWDRIRQEQISQHQHDWMERDRLQLWKERDQIRLERDRIDMERERISMEREKTRVEQSKLDIELKKYEMAEKCVVLPPAVEQHVPVPQTTTVEVSASPSQADEAAENQLQEIDDIEQDINESDERMMVMIGSRRVAKGHKIQRYSADGTQLLETYQGKVDVLRHFQGTTATLLNRAILTNTVYKEFRWAYLSKDKPDDTIQEIGSSEGTVEGAKHGPVAMLKPDRSRIEQVFPTQRAAAAYFSFASNSVISLALKDGNRRCGGHYFRMWDDCDEDLQQDFLARHSLPEPHKYVPGTSVVKLHPVTLKPLKIYTSYGQCTKIHHFGMRTLQKAIASGELLQGFRWKEMDGSS